LYRIGRAAREVLDPKSIQAGVAVPVGSYNAQHASRLKSAPADDVP
jgi:hypothetical protein